MNSQFNAIDYAQQLEAPGVPLAQAEVHARTLSLALTNCAASRADLHALDERITTRMDLFEQRITAKMDKLVAEMSARMDNFEARMVLRFEKMEGGSKLTQWMAATNSAMLIALIVKVFFP